MWDIQDPDACWLWQGMVRSDGYGQFTERGRAVYAHRRAYELAHGPIPVGMQVCHTCDNRLCGNPRHLWLGTNADNTRDRTRKLRSRVPRGKPVPESVVSAVRAEYAAGASQMQLARTHGISQSWISRIVRGLARTP